MGERAGGVCDEDDYGDDDKGLAMGVAFGVKREGRMWGESDGVVGGDDGRGQQSFTIEWESEEWGGWCLIDHIFIEKPKTATVSVVSFLHKLDWRLMTQVEHIFHTSTASIDLPKNTHRAMWEITHRSAVKTQRGDIFQEEKWCLKWLVLLEVRSSEEN